MTMKKSEPCPYCDGCGKIPTQGGLEEIRVEALTGEFTKKELCESAGVDPAMWTRERPEEPAVPGWLRLAHVMRAVVSS